MIRRPPRSTRTDTLFPYTTLFRARLPKRGVPMSVVPLRTEARSRGVRMLRTALGVSVAGWLDDPATIEVMLNPDGRLWIDRLGEGVSDTGERMAAADGERVIRLVAHHVGVDVHADMPRVSAELPDRKSTRLNSSH